MAVSKENGGFISFITWPAYLNNPVQDFTIELWILVSNTVSLSQDLVYTGSWAQAKGITWILIPSSWKMTAITRLGAYYNSISNVDVSDYVDTPTHYALTKEGTDLYVYINGELKAISGRTAYSHPYDSDRFNLLMNSGGASNPDSVFLQEFRVWNYARTQRQINNYMYSDVGPSTLGLDMYLRLNEGFGTTVFDSSPNGHDGTLYQEGMWVPDFVKLGPRIITASITFHGHSAATFGTPVKKATGSITFRGHADMFMSAIKTAVGKITFRGTSTMSLIGLVLRELEGIYQISSSEISSRNQPILSEDLANYIEVWINPMVPAATAEEIYRSKEAEAIPPGETKVFSVEFDEEPVIEAAATLENAGPNLSIIMSDTKYYGSTAEIAIYNSGTTAETCVIVVTGKPLEVQGRRKIVVKDEESILDHGLVKYKFDSPLVQDEASARDIGQKILRLFSVARANIEITWRGDPAQELADICQIPEFEKLGITKKENFYITRQHFVVEGGGLDVSMAGRKVPKVEE